MKLEKLVGDRYKERPNGCTAESHALMLRGGYMKAVASGIYSAYPPLRRITRKIETIIREEMDVIGGQEVTFPVVMPASLWQESGRYDSIGAEMGRFCDRSGAGLVLGMTHEETAVQLVREYANSYTKYPFMIYQIQTKFRDEARPRGGLIRVREFTMKDAYSFHTSQADLEEFYAACHKAYENIYRRVGLPVISVAADSGMMGGSISHEFMFLTPIGEDSIVLCDNCDYSANREAAECIIQNAPDPVSEKLKPIHTPGAKTIEDVCAFLNLPKEKSCKAVVYQCEDGSLVVLFLRGDIEVNETKLSNFLGCEIRPAALDENNALAAGYIGPYGLAGDCTVLFDRSLMNTNNLCCGANKPEYHYIGLDLARDLGTPEYHDFAKAIEGGICPKCGRKTLKLSRGIEVGNIFQLGDKYTETMGMTYLDQNGETKTPVMGCYGIGVGRLAASICEAHHDDYGPIWPLSVAPWQVHLCAVRPDDPAVRKTADDLYQALQNAAIEVIYDDRPVSAGAMFADADLLGVPLRVIVSPRNLQNNCVELVTRDKSQRVTPPVEEAVETIQNTLNKLK
ncbi:MAG TPA: proline--tRNA ligase [Oscillospiraceae bacterium]|nr:proline--tRNA ligase [Oscillospiraceae bacterium]HPS33744.1 proline--tRNA ligase [Oscillospiraceae bacterium]